MGFDEHYQYLFIIFIFIIYLYIIYYMPTFAHAYIHDTRQSPQPHLFEWPVIHFNASLSRPGPGQHGQPYRRYIFMHGISAPPAKRDYGHDYYYERARRITQMPML